MCNCTPKSGGQFELESGGHFTPKLVVNLHWNRVVNLTGFSTLGRSACLLGYRTQYFSMNKFRDAVTQARFDGSYLKWIRGISANKLLILDDFGLIALNNDARIALLDILEDRYGLGSTMITSQLPVDT
ncbi:ATP-binding protein [Flavobacterium sp. DSR3-2]|uniref:ATP-binding protein n=1 Tax=Flavobacterium sp. DSR3-2 TaxID=2804634 RepID=UPI003CEBA241